MIDWNATAAWLGLIGSALLWIDKLVKGRKHIELKILDYSSIRDIYHFFVLCENRSSQPVSINSFQLINDEVPITCKLEPTAVKSSIKRSGNEIIGTYMVKTIQFPINLSHHESQSFYLEFVECPKTSLAPDTQLTFQICTNRGTIKKLLTLGDMSYYLRARQRTHA